MRGAGRPKSRSMARSTSRWPPCAAGSMSRARPSAPASTLPPHRSPCSRAGGSGGPASSGRRAATASTARRPAASRPACGSTREQAVLGVERGPVVGLRAGQVDASRAAGRRAARRAARRRSAGAPAACSAARSRPSRSSPAASSRPASIHASARRRGGASCTASTSGTAAPAARQPPQPRGLRGELPRGGVAARLDEHRFAALELHPPGVVDVAARDPPRGDHRAPEQAPGRLGDHNRPEARRSSRRPRQAASTRSSTRSKPSGPP